MTGTVQRCHLAAMALQGESDATLTFWNFCVGLEAKGMRRTMTAGDVLTKLGRPDRWPLSVTCFVADGRNVTARLFARFFAMTSEAKKILAEIACRVAAARSPDRHQRRRRTGPYVAAAARSGLSLVWKIVLIVELLGRPSGVGFEIGVAFQLFDVTRILAYALTFVAVMLAIENLLVQPLERYVFRWRTRPA